MELKDNDELAEAFRRGDREVLHEIYEEFHDDVEKLLRGGFTFTSDGDTMRFQGFREPFRLREVIQDAFIHAFRERVREGYDPSRSYRPYLLTVVKNHMIDRFRRKKLERDLFVAADAVAEPDENEQEVLDRIGGEDDDEKDPEREALRSELASLLETFLEDLNDEDAAIVKQHLLGDLTQHEMADHLDTNRNRVRKRIRRIRHELLGHLKREGFVGRSEVGDVLQNVAEIGLIEALA